MSVSGVSRFAVVLGIAAFAFSGCEEVAEDNVVEQQGVAQEDVVDPAKGDLPNPNPTVIKNWAPLLDARSWGSTAGVDIGPDGHVWAHDRCGAYALAGGCDTSDEAVEREGNVYAAEGPNSRETAEGGLAKYLKP